MTSLRFLGIDYGTKRIGLAISDERRTLAFPKEIILNDEDRLKKIGAIIKNENVSEIIIGESVDFKNEPNKISGEVVIFIKELKDKFQLPVSRQKEFLTSVEARRYDTKGKAIDASAAALILQRYLDKINK